LFDKKQYLLFHWNISRNLFCVIRTPYCLLSIFEAVFWDYTCCCLHLCKQQHNNFYWLLRPHPLIILCSPFLIIDFKLVEKEFQRPSLLNCLWSPYSTLGLELVDKEIKRLSSLIFFCSPLLKVDFKLVGKEIKRPHSLIISCSPF
jgi:hypothetical protein